jgi:hypothetical protein
MQRAVHRYVPGWFGFAGAVGAVVSVLALTGCPGTLDPELAKMATGAGNSTGTGGGGTGGGGTGGGGSSGTGGTVASNCTGGNDGAMMVASICATSGCHDTSDAPFSGGLDLTVNSSIGSRLVGGSAGTVAQNSSCTGMGPYLDPGSNPATGLLIDKVKATFPCGNQMPFGGTPLTAQQQTCLVQWATTLTSP